MLNSIFKFQELQLLQNLQEMTKARVEKHLAAMTQASQLATLTPVITRHQQMPSTVQSSAAFTHTGNGIGAASTIAPAVTEQLRSILPAAISPQPQVATITPATVVHKMATLTPHPISKEASIILPALSNQTASLSQQTALPQQLTALGPQLATIAPVTVATAQQLGTLAAIKQQQQQLNTSPTVTAAMTQQLATIAIAQQQLGVTSPALLEQQLPVNLVQEIIGKNSPAPQLNLQQQLEMIQRLATINQSTRTEGI